MKNKDMSEYYTKYRAEIEPLLIRVFRTIDNMNKDISQLHTLKRTADAENLTLLSERMLDAAYDLEYAADLAKKR